MALAIATDLVERLMPFQVLRKLGDGGMGSVYEVMDRYGHRLAVKVVHPTVMASVVTGEDLFADFQAAAQVSHPYLCRLYDVHHDERITFLTMAYIPGRSLRTGIKNRRHRPLEQGGSLALKAIQGVAALHAANLIHGDVRPVNILVTEGNGIKLIDYGVRYPAALCKPTQLPEHRTYTGYLAPEVWRGTEPNQLSDVYGLGVLTYHLLAGYKPRQSPTQKAVLPLRNRGASVSVEIESWVLRALSLKPEERPPSALAMLKELASILKAQGTDGESEDANCDDK